MNRLLKIGIICLAVIVCSVAVHLIYSIRQPSRASLEVTLNTESPDNFKIYWALENDEFNETKSCSVEIIPTNSEYRLNLSDFKEVEKLRIDPMENTGRLTIKQITLTQVGYAPVEFKTEEQFKSLYPANQIRALNFSSKGLMVVSEGDDPQLEVRIVPSVSYFSYVQNSFMKMYRSSLGLFFERASYLGLEPISFAFFFIDFLIIVSISASILRIMRFDFGDSTSTAVAAGIMFFCMVVLSTMLMGVFKLLTWKCISVFHLLLWIGVHTYLSLNQKKRFILSALDSFTGLVNSIFTPFKTVANRKNWGKESFLTSILIITITIILIIYFIPSVFTLPLNFDSNNYRLPRIGYWLQERNLYHYNALDPRQLYMPINADLVMLWATSFFNQGYPLVHLPQFLGGVLSCISTFAIGRKVGLTKLFSLAAALFFLGIPNSASQMFTSQTDLFTTGCLVAGIYFLFDGLKTGSAKFYLLFGLGLGLAVGAKGTVFFWGPGLAVLFLGLMVYQRPKLSKVVSGLLLAVVAMVGIGGFNYAQNLLTYKNILAPSEKVVFETFPKHTNRSMSESVLIRAMALFWQVFDPSSNIPILHPITNAGLKNMEKQIRSRMEGLKSPYVKRFDKATRWIGSQKLNEDYMTFGFLSLLLFGLGGMTAGFNMLRFRDSKAIPVLLIAISVIVYFIFFPIVRGWSVHQYRYAVILTPFMSIVSLYFFQNVFYALTISSLKAVVATIIFVVLLGQTYMAFYISFNSLNHGWNAILRFKKRPNYYYLSEMNKLLKKFEDKQYKIGLLVGKGPWTSVFYRRPLHHHITYLNLPLPKTIDFDYFIKNNIDVMVIQHWSGVRLKGDYNVYQTKQNLAAIMPCNKSENCHPWISHKDMFDDRWLASEGSFQLGNWPKSIFDWKLSNPTPLQRKIILSSSLDIKEIDISADQSDFFNASLKIAENDTIEWKIIPSYIPKKHMDSKDERKLGLKYFLKPISINEDKK